MTKWHGTSQVFIVLGTIAWVSGCTTPIDDADQVGDPASTGMRDASEKVEANRENVDEAKIDFLRDYQNRVREAGNLTFEEFEASVYRESDGGKYIVDGDTPIDDRKHLEEFFDTKVKTLHRPARQMGELIVNTSGGVDTAWSDTEKHNLSYCVSRSFGARYDVVVDAMADATGAWEAAADINFIHDTSHDSNCKATNSQVLFDIRPVSSVPYLARAFFLTTRDQAATY